jgi:membrane protease YdiL (CAAX protease family)
MRTAGAVLAIAYALAIVVGLPLRGQVLFNRLLELMKSDSGAKLRFYRRNTVAKVLLVAPVVVIGLLAGSSAKSIGIALPELHTSRAQAGLGLFFALLVGLALGAVRMRRAVMTRSLTKQPRLLAFVPANRSERMSFVGVALSAGVCEEVIYRGFGVAFTRWAWPAATTADICLVTAVAFGLVHIYQGPRGVASIAVVGFILGFIAISTGSLILVMVIHTLLDLRVLMIPGRRIADAKEMLASGASSGAVAAAQQALPPPGWYPDPWNQPGSGSAQVRWWDGRQWTPHWR